MKKKKIIIGVCGILCVALVAVAIMISGGDKATKNKSEDSDQVKLTGTISTPSMEGIQSLMDGKYANLVYNEFTSNIDVSQGLYKLKIERNTEANDRTFLENYQIMDEIMNQFYGEDFDKSYITVDFYVDDDVEEVNFNDIEKVCLDDNYNKVYDAGFIFGDDGKFMVQMTEELTNVWFCRHGFSSVLPDTCRSIYRYVTCIRPVEDVDVNLKDGTFKLSELEEQVLDYLQYDFPLPHDEDISFGIAEAMILDNEAYDGVRFVIRRIYKGIPFEYGSTGASGEYIDDYDHDTASLVYAESGYIDTLAGFGYIDAEVVEMEQISQIITLEDALGLLSDKIGDNSVYDVYGVELVYRGATDKTDKSADDIYTPRWKVTTINQNDDKYTLFYIDVVTGEITERFEYYE